MDKERKALELIRNIKNPKLRAELRKDLMKLVKLKQQKAAFDEAVLEYGNKFKSTKIH
jgi:hypothetical protein